MYFIETQVGASTETVLILKPSPKALNPTPYTLANILDPAVCSLVQWGPKSWREAQDLYSEFVLSLYRGGIDFKITKFWISSQGFRVIMKKQKDCAIKGPSLAQSSLSWSHPGKCAAAFSPLRFPRRHVNSGRRGKLPDVKHSSVEQLRLRG